MRNLTVTVHVDQGADENLKIALLLIDLARELVRRNDLSNVTVSHPGGIARAIISNLAVTSTLPEGK